MKYFDNSIKCYCISLIFFYRKIDVSFCFELTLSILKLPVGTTLSLPKLTHSLLGLSIS